MPITSILIEQAISSTPLSWASLIKSSKLSIFLSFIIVRIILAPIPPIFIFESDSFFEPRGIIIANIFEIKFFLILTFSGRRMIFSPQKVKNIVTFRPIAAAPLAIINDAIALSKSPEKTIIFLLFLFPFEILFCPFFILALLIPLLQLSSISSLPVRRQ